MMFNTGATISIMMDTWAQAHGLEVKPLPVTGNGVVSVAAFNGMLQPMAGMTDFVLQVGQGVELTLTDVMVLAGGTYQGILGADVWMGKDQVLGSIVATLPTHKESGHFTWHVYKAGVHAHDPFLPLSGGKVAAVAPRTAPAPTTTTTLAPALLLTPPHCKHFPANQQMALDTTAG